MERSEDGRLTVPWISRIAKPVGVSSNWGSGFEGGITSALDVRWRGMVGIGNGYIGLPVREECRSEYMRKLDRRLAQAWFG